MGSTEGQGLGYNQAGIGSKVTADNVSHHVALLVSAVCSYSVHLSLLYNIVVEVFRCVTHMSYYGNSQMNIP